MGILVYSKKDCIYCDKAKRLLESKWMFYEEVDIVETDRVQEMISRSGRRTVPQIFIDEQHVGGYTDLCDMLGVNTN